MKLSSVDLFWKNYIVLLDKGDLTLCIDGRYDEDVDILFYYNK